MKKYTTETDDPNSKYNILFCKSLRFKLQLQIWSSKSQKASPPNMPYNSTMSKSNPTLLWFSRKCMLQIRTGSIHKGMLLSRTGSIHKMHAAK